jgi:hypothetical protein
MGTVHDIDTQRRAELTGVVLQVLDDWGIEPARQLSLLGYREGTPARLLVRLRRGEPLAETAETSERVRHILAIRRALQAIHPHSVDMANLWVTTPHLFFNDQTPLDVMLARGLDGMRRVVEHLDGTGDWG